MRSAFSLLFLLIPFILNIIFDVTIVALLQPDRIQRISAMRRENKKAALSAFYIVLSVAHLWRFYFIGNLVPFRRGLRISALPIPTEKQSLRKTLEKNRPRYFSVIQCLRIFARQCWRV